MAELAAEFRSEQDYLGECNKNRLLAAAECFAHAAIRRRSEKGIRAWMSRSGDSIQSMRRKIFVVEQTQSINIYIYICLLRYKRSAPKQGMVGASNFRTVHRYRFILRTWSNFTTLRGLVRSQSCLVRRNWTKQRKESARPEQRPTKTVIT